MAQAAQARQAEQARHAKQGGQGRYGGVDWKGNDPSAFKTTSSVVDLGWAILWCNMYSAGNTRRQGEAGKAAIRPATTFSFGTPNAKGVRKCNKCRFGRKG